MTKANKQAHDLNIERFLEKINWLELHKECVLTDDYNDLIVIWLDGTFENLGNDMPNTTNYYFSVHTYGFGNVDASAYADGWATELQDGYGNYTRVYANNTTGERMTQKEMVTKCIEDGDWDHVYDAWKQELREQHFAFLCQM